MAGRSNGWLAERAGMARLRVAVVRVPGMANRECQGWTEPESGMYCAMGGQVRMPGMVTSECRDSQSRRGRLRFKI